MENQYTRLFFPDIDFLRTLDDYLFFSGLGVPFIFACSILIYKLEKHRIRRRKILLAWIMMILSMCPEISSLFGGLRGATGRWHYLVAFSVAYAIPVIIENILSNKLSIKQIGLFSICIAFMLASRSLSGCVALQGKWLLAIGILCLSVGLLIAGSYYNQSKKAMKWDRRRILVNIGFKCTLIFTIICPMLIMSILVPDINGLLRNGFVPGGNVPDISKKEQSFFYGLQANVEGSEFWRIADDSINHLQDFDVNKETSYANNNNFPMITGYFGTSAYCSLVSKTVHDWIKRQHHVRQILQSPSIYYGLDGRRFLDTMWSIRYHVDRSQLSYEEYPTNLGIDLWYDTVISPKRVNQLDDAQKDALLLQVAEVDEDMGVDAGNSTDNVTTEISGSDLKGANLIDCDLKGNILTVGKMGAIEFDLAGKHLGDGEFLVNISLDRLDEPRWENREDSSDSIYNYNLEIAGKPLAVVKSNYKWAYPVDSFTIKVDSEIQKIPIRISKGIYRLNDFSIKFNSYDRLEDWIKQLNRNNLENLIIDNDQISGNITNKSKGILALSVPYDDGWRAFDNGKKLEIHKIDNVLLGVVLEPGKHQIVFKFCPKYLIECMVISCFCTLILLCILIINRKQRQLEKMN